MQKCLDRQSSVGETVWYMLSETYTLFTIITFGLRYVHISLLSCTSMSLLHCRDLNRYQTAQAFHTIWMRTMIHRSHLNKPPTMSQVLNFRHWYCFCSCLLPPPFRVFINGRAGLEAFSTCNVLWSRLLKEKLIELYKLMEVYSNSPLLRVMSKIGLLWEKALPLGRISLRVQT